MNCLVDLDDAKYRIKSLHIYHEDQVKKIHDAPLPTAAPVTDAPLRTPQPLTLDKQPSVENIWKYLCTFLPAIDHEDIRRLLLDERIYTLKELMYFVSREGDISDLLLTTQYRFAVLLNDLRKRDQQIDMKKTASYLNLPELSKSKDIDENGNHVLPKELVEWIQATILPGDHPDAFYIAHKEEITTPQEFLALDFYTLNKYTECEADVLNRFLRLSLVCVKAQEQAAEMNHWIETSLETEDRKFAIDLIGHLGIKTPEDFMNGINFTHFKELPAGVIARFGTLAGQANKAMNKAVNSKSKTAAG